MRFVTRWWTLDHEPRRHIRLRQDGDRWLVDLEEADRVWRGVFASEADARAYIEQAMQRSANQWYQHR